MADPSYSKPDFYAKKAKDEGFLARSVYKLKEMDEKYQLFKKNMKILDLGASPGSWSQYVLKKIGSKDQVVGIDIKKITHPLGNQFHFIHGSIEDYQKELLSLGPYDSVISDMAPNTSGVKSEDVFLSHELSFIALNVAIKSLKPKGFFICKIFQGDGIDEFYVMLKKNFKRFKTIKPKAVRKNSKEIYVIAWEIKK